METWRQTVDLNLSSAHLVTRVVGPHLQPGAAICNTASIAGIMPGSLFAYGAVKMLIPMGTEQTALDIGEAVA